MCRFFISDIKLQPDLTGHNNMVILPLVNPKCQQELWLFYIRISKNRIKPLLTIFPALYRADHPLRSEA